MTFVWNASDVSRAIASSKDCCAVKYHCLGSFAVGFSPFAQLKAARPHDEPESMTRIFFGPHSAGSDSSGHFVRCLSEFTHAFGDEMTGPDGPMRSLSRSVT